MNAASLQYFLFPHMTLSEESYRHMAVLLPHLALMQVVRPPAIPPWGPDIFFPWPAIVEQEQLEQVKQSLKGYQQFADLHGKNLLDASISHDWIADDFRESRFRIRSEIKGSGGAGSENDLSWFYEAAVFLEVARDLDEREMELESKLVRVESLEEEFRTIVGITTEEDQEEPLAMANLPLVSEKAYLRYMLPKRINSWLRLFFNKMPLGSPIFVAAVPEVVEDLTESIVSARERAGGSSRVAHIPLASFPALGHVNAEVFLALLHEVRRSDLYTAYRQGIENVTKEPGNASLLDGLGADVAALGEYLDDLCRKEHLSEERQMTLTLVHMEGLTVQDLLNRLDASVSPATNKTIRSETPVSLLLCT